MWNFEPLFNEYNWDNWFCRGADPQAVDEEGRTPIELAAQSNFEDNEVLALLSDSNGWGCLVKESLNVQVDFNL